MRLSSTLGSSIKRKKTSSKGGNVTLGVAWDEKQRREHEAVPDKGHQFHVKNRIVMGEESLRGKTHGRLQH